MGREESSPLLTSSRLIENLFDEVPWKHVSEHTKGNRICEPAGPLGWVGLIERHDPTLSESSTGRRERYGVSNKKAMLIA